MYKNWSYNPTQRTYTAMYEVAPAIPPGIYVLKRSNFGELLMDVVEQKHEKICHFSNGPLQPILNEIDEFWNNRARYERLGAAYKRGILLHGPAGCGKSGILTCAVQDMVERKGIIIREGLDVENLTWGCPLLRQIENDRPVLIIIENLDEVCDYDEGSLVEMMDGISSIDGVLFLMTTNYINKVSARVRRPSRIDTLLEINYPEETHRLEYLKFLCNDYPEKTIQGITLENLANKTQGFSLAELKELVISCIIYQHNPQDSIQRLWELRGNEEEGEDNES